MIKDCKLGDDVKIPYPDLINLYGCEIGANTFIGPFVEIQKGVKIGTDCKIESHTFICEGVEIGNRVFVGHGVMFINDRSPEVYDETWEPEVTFVKDNASIGSNATIFPVSIGRSSFIGAGAVVVKDVGDFEKVVGNPAKVVL